MPRTKKPSQNYRPKSKALNKQIKTVVQQQLSKELEEKNAIVQYDNVPIQRNIPSGTVFNGVGNFFQLLPTISQSTTGGAGKAYSERVGNEICLKNLKIKYYLNYNQPDALEIRPQDHKIGVRVMILKAKEFNDVSKAFDAMPTDRLIRFGTYTGTSGPGSFNADPLDLQSSINRDVFTVRYDKTHVLTAPVSISGASSVDTVAIPSGLKFGQKTLTFGKSGMTLKYSSQGDTIANNFGYFMVLGYVSLSSPNQPASGLVNATVNCVAQFTDA